MKNELKLAKTHDVCKAGEPELTVVLIHGIASDSSSFDGLLEYLEDLDEMRTVRFVAFDLLGAGKSNSSDELNFDFDEQLTALDNSINELNITTPLVIISHSMGTMITARYADNHKRLVKGLILVSPPIYSKEDLENPFFMAAMDGFREIVRHKNRQVAESKAFNNEIENIILNPGNHRYFEKITQPTKIIYGELDKLIIPTNIPKLVKCNPNVTTVKTAGSHGVTHEKYSKVMDVLKKFLKESR